MLSVTPATTCQQGIKATPFSALSHGGEGRLAAALDGPPCHSIRDLALTGSSAKLNGRAASVCGAVGVAMRCLGVFGSLKSPTPSAAAGSSTTAAATSAATAVSECGASGREGPYVAKQGSIQGAKVPKRCDLVLPWRRLDHWDRPHHLLCCQEQAQQTSISQALGFMRYLLSPFQQPTLSTLHPRHICTAYSRFTAIANGSPCYSK
jgi:hypothetical protein